MKKFLVLLLLYLPFFADAQLTKTAIKSQIDSRLSKQVRTSDVRYVLKLITDLAGKADSTALAHSATAITSATSLKEGIIPTPRYGPEVVLTESVQSLKNKSIDLGFNQITGLTLAHVSGLSQALADKQAKITAGTTSQYLRGDLSLATFPAIPTAANYVATTGVQTAIGGNKSWVGTHSFGSTLNVAGISTLAGISLSADMLPSTANSVNIGSTASPFASMYAGFVGRNGRFTFGTTSSSQDIDIQQGTSGVNIGVFKGTTGNLHLFPKGTNPTEKGARLYVDGPTKITGGLIVNPDSLPEYASNADAVAGGVPAGKFYKSVEGDEWIIKVAHPIGSLLAFTTNAPSGDEEPFDYTDNIGEVLWRTQTPNQPYSFKYVSNRPGRPMFRVELRPGDNFLSDVSPYPNSQNPKYDPNDPNKDEPDEYQIKERSEGYTKSFPTVGGTYYYISYSFLVEPGPDVYYSNPDFFCYLGQWHNSDTDKGPVPFAFNFSGQNRLQLQIREFTNTATQLKTNATLKPRGQWNSMVIRVKFNTSSTSTKNGEFAWWVNEVQQDNLTGLDLGSLTMPDGAGGQKAQPNKGYWKGGIYRTAGSPDTSPGVPSSTAPRVNLAVQYANMRVTTTNLTVAPNNKITSPDPVD